MSSWHPGNKWFKSESSQSVQSLSCVWLFATPWTAAHQAFLSISNSWNFIESVMPSNHLIPCRPLLLLPSVFPSIRVFFNESVLCIRWPKYWSFSFSISLSSEHSGLISFRIDWLNKSKEQLKKKKTNQKMSRRPKQEFLQRRHTDGQPTHEKMLSITNC